MKQTLLFLLTFLLLVYQGTSQTVLNENFNYATGGLTNAALNDNVSGGNWAFLNGSNNRITVVDSNLNYPGYGSSGIGKCIRMVSSTLISEAGSHTIASRISGTVYSALLIRLSDTAGISANASTTGDYFFAMFSGGGNANHFSRLTIRKGSTGNTFQLGIRSNPSAAVSFASANLSTNTTHLIVVSYSFNTGTNNDSAMLWLNPSTSVQPVADAKSIITTGGDAPDIGKILVRQGTAGTPNGWIDGIHAGITWQDVMGADPGPPPSVNTFTYIKYGMSFCTLNWKIPGDYDKNTMQTLAFIKKGTAINAGTPDKPLSYYVANPDFRAATTKLSYDTNARCIYSGDTNTVNVVGMDTGATYYINYYVIRNNDSACSLVMATSFNTQTKTPLTITDIGYTNTYYTSTQLNWVKPIGYDPATMSILVFVKQGARVYPVGPVDADPATYIANADFSKSTSLFQSDSLGFCVYNGDGDNVKITGLISGRGYFSSMFVVRKLDSNYYSAQTNIYVLAKSQPVYVYNLIAQPTGRNSIHVIYARGVSYTNSSMTTVVFVKKGSPVSTVDYPDEPANLYLPDPDFSKTTSGFEYDSMARCVMNSDSDHIDISGLEPNTVYHFLVYVIRTYDTSYSIASTTLAKTFGDVPPLTSASGIIFTATGNHTAKAFWFKDSTYNDTISRTLVFMKKGSPVQLGLPNKDPLSMVSDTAAGVGTPFQLDSAATCVFNGTGNHVEVSGLQSGTKYYLAAYVVRTVDSLYSTALVANAYTMTDSVSAINMTGVSSTAVKISWNKPPKYLNDKYSTLVFLKADSTIANNSPTGSGNNYFANSIFGLGASFQYDPKAFCVFRGDTDFVMVTNLIQGKSYHATIYILREEDSMYSQPAFGMGYTLPKQSLRSIGSVNKTNAMSGLPDSLNLRVTLRGVVYGFNQRTTGLKMLMRDYTGGITINSVGINATFNLKEGDSLEVQGNIGSERGLCELMADTIRYLSSGLLLKLPTMVTRPSEQTENDLIAIGKVKFLSLQTGLWSAKNYLVVNEGMDTITLQVFPNGTIIGKPFPATTYFELRGLSSQISSSNSAPFTADGYLIIPRSVNDIIPIPPDTLNPFHLLSPATGASLTLQGDPLTEFTFSWNAASGNGTQKLMYTFQLDSVGGNFTSPKINMSSSNSGMDSTFKISSVNLSTILHLIPGKTFYGKWRIKAEINGFERISADVYPIQIIRKNYTGVADADEQHDLLIYPNPARNKIFVKSGSIVKSILLINMAGQVCKQNQPDASDFAIELDLEPGVYFIMIETESGWLKDKLVIE